MKPNKEDMITKYEFTENGLREYAKEVAIGFDQWKRDEKYAWNQTDKKYYAAWDLNKEYTPEQLFNQYLQSLNQPK